MFSNEKWFGNPTSGFYNSVITSSCRFNGSTSKLVSPAFGADLGNTWTWSAWVKFTNQTSDRRGSLFNPVGNSASLYFDNTNQDFLSVNDDGSAVRSTSTLLRDPTSWYHIVLNGNGTLNKLWINGVLATFGTDPNLDDFNKAVAHQIGGSSFGTNYFFDGIMADINFVSETALDYTAFAEDKNGVLIPKEPSVTYGANGFRLQFKQTGSGADASGIGADTSGNNKHFTATGLDAYDVLPDSPENNFCTFNPLEPTNMTLAEGNLETDKASNASNDGVNGTFLLTSGKWYFEFKPKYFSGGSGAFGNVGVRNPSGSAKDALGSGNAPNATVLYLFDGNVQDFNSDTTYFPTGGSGYTYGATGSEMIYGVALDMDNGKIWFSINGTYPNSGNPATGTNEARDDINTNHPNGVFPAISSYNVAFIANFGQNPSFNGDVGNSGHTAGTESDSNGIGLFKYAPPTGFLAVCSANLPDTTISPNQSEQADDHMDILSYTGDGTSSRNIDGLNFQPDWIWFAQRNNTSAKPMFDSSRGVNKALYSTSNIADDDSSQYGYLSVFRSQGGFTATAGSTNNNYLNENNVNIVGWSWKAGGTTPTKTYKVLVVADSTDYGHGIGANKYRFYKSDNSTPFPQSAVDLDLQEGGTYTFDWSSATSHPIRFSLTNDGTHSSGTSAGSEYTTGVVKDDSAYKTTITVASGVASLYYYCQNHSGMGAEVRTNVEFGQTNFDGNLLSVSQTNVTAGFSIVKYTGNGDNPNADGTSVGHGLTSTPEMIIHKNRDSTTAGNNYWTVWTPFHSANNMSFLSFTSNNTGGWAGYNTIGNTTFSPPDLNYGNVSGEDYIVYLWHSVAGYSKIGQFEMNNNSDGTYVFCGFRPRWLMTKPIDQAGSWSIYDSERDSFNDGDANMSQAENTTAESGFANSAVDFLSNGFKLRHSSSDGYSNIATNTAIFMAFGNDFKFSNAR